MENHSTNGFVSRATVNRVVLLALVIVISAVFLAMIRGFLMAILLAGIFSGLVHPLYRRFNVWFRGHRAVASLLTMLLLVLVVLLPLGTLLGIVTAQAIKVGESVTPWVQQNLAQPDRITQALESLPFYDRLEPYREQILTRAGELVGTVSTFLINGLSAATVGTVNFLFLVFVLLYTMFFFLMDGDKLLARILYYLPLQDEDERRIIDKFTSVTRATLKGTAVIGMLQGALAGIAFAVVGIQGAVFWGTIMTVLSIIPGIGTGLIWVPAAIILIAGGSIGKGIGLAVFCGVIVGSIDNFLRPRLVGKDTQMHDLMILFGTMGGIVMFGVLGFIIGPIVAALFITVWDIYGVVFRGVLPEVRWVGADRDQEALAAPEQEDDSDDPDNDRPEDD